MVSLSVSGGNAVGFTAGISATGGAATVGKSWLKSAVAVDSGGLIGMGEAVAVGSKTCEAGALKSSGTCVGVWSSGWNGVGVGDAFGADVIRIKGADDRSDVWGGAHADKKIARRIRERWLDDEFILLWVRA